MDSNYEFNAIQANRASQATKCTFYMLRVFVGIVNIVVVFVLQPALSGLASVCHLGATYLRSEAVYSGAGVLAR
jgi:hypothetical protein